MKSKKKHVCNDAAQEVKTILRKEWVKNKRVRKVVRIRIRKCSICGKRKSGEPL